MAERTAGATRFVCCPECSHQFEIDLAARLWGSVDKDGPGGCWIWRGAIAGGGYGQIRVDGNQRKTHRVAYELVVGPIPDGHVLDHLCENRRCVNPYHLEPVTQQVNQMRGMTTLAAKNAAKTHCPQGHPYDEENTRQNFTARGRSRRCRACAREDMQRRRAA